MNPGQRMVVRVPGATTMDHSIREMDGTTVEIVDGRIFPIEFMRGHWMIARKCISDVRMDSEGRPYCIEMMINEDWLHLSDGS